MTKKAFLIVGDDDVSHTILRVLQNKRHIKEKLKEVKINMKIEKPYLDFGKKSKRMYGITEILQYLQPPNIRQKPHTKPNTDYDERTLRHLYTDNIKTPIADDDDIDENVKVMKKKQFEEQYLRHENRLGQTVVPKRVQIEPQLEDYIESPEEKKADELDSYYQSIIQSHGD